MSGNVSDERTMERKNWHADVRNERADGKANSIGICTHKDFTIDFLTISYEYTYIWLFSIEVHLYFEIAFNSIFWFSVTKVCLISWWNYYILVAHWINKIVFNKVRLKEATKTYINYLIRLLLCTYQQMGERVNSLNSPKLPGKAHTLVN